MEVVHVLFNNVIPTLNQFWVFSQVFSSSRRREIACTRLLSCMRLMPGITRQVGGLYVLLLSRMSRFSLRMRGVIDHIIQRVVISWGRGHHARPWVPFLGQTGQINRPISSIWLCSLLTTIHVHWAIDMIGVCLWEVLWCVGFPVLVDMIRRAVRFCLTMPGVRIVSWSWATMPITATVIRVVTRHRVSLGISRPTRILIASIQSLNFSRKGWWFGCGWRRGSASSLIVSDTSWWRNRAVHWNVNGPLRAWNWRPTLYTLELCSGRAPTMALVSMVMSLVSMVMSLRSVMQHANRLAHCQHLVIMSVGAFSSTSSSSSWARGAIEEVLWWPGTRAIPWRERAMSAGFRGRVGGGRRALIW